VVPAKKRLGSDQEMAGARRRAAPGQAGEQSAIRWSERRPLHLTAEHRHLVAEDDDLDGQFVAIAAEKSDELKDSEKSEVGRPREPQATFIGQLAPAKVQVVVPG
jgi:hypothetical protein